MPAGSTADRTTGLLLVTVATEERRLDVQIPGWLPLAELVPGLVRALALAPEVAWRVTTTDGRVLEPDVDLLRQGVADGAVLALVAAPGPPPVHDDPADAVAEAVEASRSNGSCGCDRQLACGAVLAMLAVALPALLFASRPFLAGTVAGLVAVVLLVVAVRRSSGVLVAASAAYAGTGGFLLGSSLAGQAAGHQGAGAAMAGLGVLGVGATAWHRLPGQVVGRVLALAGGAAAALGAAQWSVPFRVAPVLVVLLVLAVLGQALSPWLLAPRPGVVPGAPSAPDTPRRADPRDLVARVERGRRSLLVATALVGLLAVGSVPWVATSGWAGAGVTVAASTMLVLGSRQHREATARTTGTVAGLTGLLATLATALWVHPGNRLALAVAAIVLGCGSAELARSLSTARRERLLELLHAVALVALVPLAVLATGLPARLGW